MRIGIICPSEIASRRFMPALQKIEMLEFVGLGLCSAYERFGENLPEKRIVDEVLQAERKKAEAFTAQYGGKIFGSYQQILDSDQVDVLYIPLPPALHYQWAKAALQSGKHVIAEKPCTLSAEQTRHLVNLAKERGLALHENYSYVFHDQLDAIDKIIADGEIGEVRLYRISFGFPRRKPGDFRFSRALGGGALMDAGGYTIHYASRLLGTTARIKYAQMNYIDPFDVDMFGSGALVNSSGVTAQIAFGMDNNYKCDLEIWGSRGVLSTGRILTAPAGFEPELTVRRGNAEEVRVLPADDAFEKSIRHFLSCIANESDRLENHQRIIRQAELVDEFSGMATAQDK